MSKLAPELAPMALQESLRAIAASLNMSWQTIIDALARQLQSVNNAFNQWWRNLGMSRKKRPSKQTRAFLATIRKEPSFTPHAHKRRRSQQRVQVYYRRYDNINWQFNQMHTDPGYWEKIKRGANS